VDGRRAGSPEQVRQGPYPGEVEIQQVIVGEIGAKAASSQSEEINRDRGGDDDARDPPAHASILPVLGLHVRAERFETPLARDNSGCRGGHTISKIKRLAVEAVGAPAARLGDSRQ